MITPQQIQQKAQKLWNSGRVLQSALWQGSLFPWVINFRKPTAKEQLEKFTEIKQWIAQLKSQSKAVKGLGYDIEYKLINHRQLGEQQLPSTIIFTTQDDLLRYVGKLREFEKLQKLAKQMLFEFPVLQDWLNHKIRTFIKYQDVWELLLSVCRYFIDNPRPNCYLRELDIAGIDSKFIEKHKAILDELLQRLLPETSLDLSITSLKQHGFEKRYGLKFDEAVIRLRLLDKALYLNNINDISLPVSQLAQWQIPCWRVFITENKINGLSFPAMQDSIVIFGLGYGIDSLAEIPWLTDCEIYYWGDIDTHGFSILSRLRQYYPQTTAIMMDEQTLQAHQSLCVKEPTNARCKNQLTGLNLAEQKLYQQLQRSHQRLEQERLPMDYVIQRLRYC